jgi:hypothetical protein
MIVNLGKLKCIHLGGSKVNSISQATSRSMTQEEIEYWEEGILTELTNAHHKALSTDYPAICIIHSYRGKDFPHIKEEEFECIKEEGYVEQDGVEYEAINYEFPEQCECGTVRISIPPDDSINIFQILEDYKTILMRKN